MSTVSEHLQGRLTLSTDKKPTAHKLESQSQLAKTLVGEDGFGFGDLVDVVNPLQHIPVVSNLYQAATGDGMGAAAKIAGAAIFGGPVGAGIAAITSLIGMAARSAEEAVQAETMPQTMEETVQAEAPVEESLPEDIAQTAKEHFLPIPETKKTEEELAAQAAAAAGHTGAFRLGTDTLPVTKSEKAAEELAQSVKPQTGILLNNPHVSDVAMRALGGNSVEHQIYRQVQTLDPLYAEAVNMKH